MLSAGRFWSFFFVAFLASKLHHVLSTRVRLQGAGIGAAQKMIGFPCQGPGPGLLSRCDFFSSNALPRGAATLGQDWFQKIGPQGARGKMKCKILQVTSWKSKVLFSHLGSLMTVTFMAVTFDILDWQGWMIPSHVRRQTWKFLPAWQRSLHIELLHDTGAVSETQWLPSTALGSSVTPMAWGGASRCKELFPKRTIAQLQSWVSVLGFSQFFFVIERWLDFMTLMCPEIDQQVRIHLRWRGVAQT